MDGQPSPSDQRGSHSTGYSNLQHWWNSPGVHEVVKNLRARLSSPAAAPPPPPRPQAPSGEVLPSLHVYNNMAYRPAMSQQAEMILSKELETVLKQVQFVVRDMGLEPIELSDFQTIPRTESEYSGQGLSYAFPEFMQPSVKANLEGLDTAQQDKALHILEKESRVVKDGIAQGISQNEITEQYGKKLHVMVDCLEKNLSLALRARHSSFSIAGLQRMFKASEEAQKLVQKVTKYLNFAQVAATIAGSTYNAIGTSPVHFGTIGNDARSILNEDFTLEKIKLNSDPAENFSAGFGAQHLAGQLLSQLMIKLKQDKYSVSCNVVYESEDQVDPIVAAIANAHPGPPVVEADNNDIGAVRIKFNKLMGYTNLKSTVLVPYPSLHGKVEIRGFNPYVSYGACAELVRNLNPVVGICGVLGVKNAGVGFQCQYAPAENQLVEPLPPAENQLVEPLPPAENQLVEPLQNYQLVPSVGMFLRSESRLLAGGVTYKHQPGIFSASVVKKLVDSTTSFGLHASYSREEGVNGGARFAVGVKHDVDPTMFCKGRIGTDGASLAVKKSFSDRLFSVKGLGHVDFNDPWRLPKFGIMFSYRHPSSERSKSSNKST